MAYSVVVRSNEPILIPRLSGEAVRVTNESTDTTVYYGSSNTVSSSSNDGSVAPGAAVTLSAAKYFVSGNFPGLLNGQIRAFVDEQTDTQSNTGRTTALNPGDSITVGTSAVDVFASNLSREDAGFTNYHLTAIVWVSRTGTAVAGSGEPVFPMQSWTADGYDGRISIISDTASTPVPRWEI